MALLDKLRGELIDIIEWVDDSLHTLVYRFPRYQNEIKNGAQLIVRPGQCALFVDQGQLADVFEPGRYELSTDNLPLLSTLRGWKYGFNSPFKCEVYFVSTRQITDLKWGTPNPIMLRDADFGPLRIRAFGTYALRAIDPKILLKELVGTDGNFQAEEVGELLRSIIVESFTSMIGQSKIAALDLAANYSSLSEQLRARVRERIDDEYGLDVPALSIVNVSLPPEVEKALDTRTSMGVLGDMGRYQQFQMGNAILAAAQNPASGAGQGLAIGAGLAMAGQFGQLGQFGQFGQQHPGQQPAPGAPPPPPGMPPPPPGGAVFHVSQGGQVQGPFPVAQLAVAIAQGQLSASTFVWAPGMAAWLPAGQVPALAAHFNAPPPPPPPIA
ncbi:MAG TPA: SPFH domain-containing protein [Polyangiaceae bacterium]|nr:SPFH domain-containing protein [Polyangiaceae bacterium]